MYVDVFYFSEREKCFVARGEVFVWSKTFYDTDVSALWFFIELEEDIIFELKYIGYGFNNNVDDVIII